MRDPLYIGIGGGVVALDRDTGSEIWSRKLKGSDFVNVAMSGRDVFASTRGEVFCLDAATGEIRWQNGLKGWGMGLVTFTGTGIAASEEENRRRAAAAAAAAGS